MSLALVLLIPVPPIRSFKEVLHVTWIPVCCFADLVPDRGVAALAEGVPVAIFRLTGDEIHAIAARDPFCGANVLSRGLVGSAGDVRYVASPMYKHRFDLATGTCLEDLAVRVPIFPVRVANGIVQVAIRSHNGRSSARGRPVLAGQAR